MRKRKNKSLKLGLIFIIIIILLMSTSVSYSLWYDSLYLDIDVETGAWEADIKIQKTLDYVIREENVFQLTITAWNDGPAILTDVEVADILEIDTTPLFGSEVLSHGYLTWNNIPVPDGEINELTWSIGDLMAGEIATLSIDVVVAIECSGEEFPSIVVYPEDGSTISVPRYDHASDTTGLGYYVVEHKYDSRAVRLENLEPNLGEDGLVQTDTFVITAMSGSTIVDVTITTKSGTSPPQGITTTLSVGDTITDAEGFTLSFISAIDIGEGLTEYTFEVTSDDIAGGQEGGTAALSHIDFDFGYYAEDCEGEVNAGATVTADAGIICGILGATTEGIIIIINENGDIQPQLPYSTPWAEDYCNYCENC